MLGIGRYSSLGIGLHVSLIDNFSAGASRVATAMGTMTRAQVNSQRMAAQSMQNNGMLMMATAGAMAIPFISAIKYSAKFNYAMSSVRSAVNLTSKEFEGLRQRAIDLGNTTIFDPEQVAKTMYDLGTAGYETAKQIQSAIRPVLDLASISNVNPDLAAKMVANIRMAFQIPESQTSYIADILSLVDNKSSAKLMELGEGMKYFAASASMMGIKLEPAMAMIGVLNSMGLHGSTAGTGPANMLKDIATAFSPFATKKQKQVLDMLGLGKKDVTDAAGNMIRLDKLVGKLFDRMAKYSPMDRAAMMSGLVQARGARAAVLSAMAGNKGIGLSYTALLEDIYKNARGSASKRSAIRNDNLEGDWMKLVAGWKSFSTVIGEALNGPLRILAKLGIQILHVMTALGSTTVGKGIIALGAMWIMVNFAAGVYNFTLGGIRLRQMQIAALNATMGASAAASWGVATAGARTYGLTLASLGATRLASAGFFMSPGGRVVSGATGRFVGEQAAIGATVAGMSRFRVMMLIVTNALRTCFTVISELVVGFLAMIGPIGWLVLGISAVAITMGLIARNASERKKTEDERMKDPAYRAQKEFKDYMNSGVPGKPGTRDEYRYHKPTLEEQQQKLDELYKKYAPTGRVRNPLSNNPNDTVSIGTVFIVQGDTVKTKEQFESLMLKIAH